MTMRVLACALPAVAALKAAHPTGDYNIKGGASTSFPEFNVQYYGASADLHGTDESRAFVSAFDKVLEKQSEILSALEKRSTKSFLMESGNFLVMFFFYYYSSHLFF